MSQSDYIQFKKTAVVLKNAELPPVLDPDQYTSFVSYNLETTVPNTKNAFSRLYLSGQQRIFNIDKNVSGCTTFPLCINTNTRANRVLNTAEKIVVNGGTQIPYKPAPTERFNKIFSPATCTFSLQNGKVKRKISCNKMICKCRLRIYGASGSY
jgi:hypothetical protein